MPDAPPAPPPNTPPPAVFKDFVPESYRDRGYLKDLLEKPQGAETTEELFKRLDGAQKLIGSRPAVGALAADAKPEEVEKWLTSLRPEKAEDYDLTALGDGSDKELLGTLREAFHHAGSDKRQVGRFLEKFAPVFAERQKAAAEAQKKMDTEFDALVAQAHGTENAKVIDLVNGALKEFTPEPYKPHLGKLSNENLAIMSSVIHAIIKKYGAEDKITPAGGAGGGGGGDVDAMRAEMSALIAKPEYRDEFHAGHAAVRAKVTELATKIAAGK